jgi:hypothetical protein
LCQPITQAGTFRANQLNVLRKGVLSRERRTESECGSERGNLKDSVWVPAREEMEKSREWRERR